MDGGGFIKLHFVCFPLPLAWCVCFLSLWLGVRLPSRICVCCLILIDPGMSLNCAPTRVCTVH